MTAEDVMRPGSTTVRPHGLLDRLIDRLRRRGVPSVLVTDPDGRLIGIIRQVDGEKLLVGEPLEEVWEECEGCPGRWRVVAAG